MYSKISISDAFVILKEDMHHNAIHLDTLHYVSRENNIIDCYQSQDVVIFYDTAGVFVCPTASEFDVNAALDLISAVYTPESVCVDVHKLNEATKTEVQEKFAVFAPYKRLMKDLVCMHPSKASVCQQVRRLTVADRELFLQSPDLLTIPNRPPLSLLFQIFVERGAGAILGYVEDNVVKGYLAYQELYKDVYDTDYVYVAEPHRKKGIGKALAVGYLDAVCGENRIALWSNAKDGASERTALSAGFEAGRESMLFMA